MNWLSVLELLRPNQWLKNLFVLAPLFFSFNFTEANIVAAVFGFVLFSLAASSIYVLNDYFDIEEDRQHPTKCNRPLASGAVSKRACKLNCVNAHRLKSHQKRKFYEQHRSSQTQSHGC